MIPDIAKRGASFKGALAYYLHDKKLEGEHERFTSERVAWTETRNRARDPVGQRPVGPLEADQQHALRTFCQITRQRRRQPGKTGRLKRPDLQAGHGGNRHGRRSAETRSGRA